VADRSSRWKANSIFKHDANGATGAAIFVPGKRNRQFASASLVLLYLLLALGVAYMGARTNVVPFVAEVDKLGYAITIPSPVTASNTPAAVERMKRYEIAARASAPI
jgi:type IV secretory pathway TrbF-like protein